MWVSRRRMPKIDTTKEATRWQGSLPSSLEVALEGS